MPSLAEQLGREYIDQFYKGAMFRLGDDVLVYRGHLNANEVLCYGVDKQRMKMVERTIRSADITSMDSFAWPKLGYRQYKYKQGVSVTNYLSMKRSAMRGLKEDFVLMDKVGDSVVFQGIHNMRDGLNQAQFAHELFFPTFTQIDEGIKQIQNGDAIAVALNEDVAMCFSCSQGPGRIADIIYRQRIIGEVTANGEVVVPHKLAKKSANLFGRRLRV